MNSKSSPQDIYSVERAWLLFVFGQNVSFLRKQRNLSQEAFAEAASLHRNAIGVIERGECEPGNGGLIWPHCGGLNWPHLRPTGS